MLEEQCVDASIGDFLSFLAVERNASENTISAYRSDLAQFQQSVIRQGISPDADDAWASVTNAMLLTFVEELRERQYRAATVARKVAAVKSFFGFMAAEGILADDPAKDLRSPQVGKALPKALSIEEVDELLEQPARRNTVVAQRDKTMLDLAYRTGMRVTELVSLDVAHVALDSTPATVRGTGKGDQERALTLDASVVAGLKHYLAEVRPRLVRNRNESALFVNRRGGRLTRQGFWLILKNYALEAGLEGITPHTLRHTYATHMLSGGMPLRNVQEALGHASISTTQIYTQLTDKQKRKAYDEAHPRA